MEEKLVPPLSPAPSSVPPGSTATSAGTRKRDEAWRPRVDKSERELHGFDSHSLEEDSLLESPQIHVQALAFQILGRGLQGCAMGVIPLGISIMRDELPPERVGGAISLMSATLGVGGAIGLPVAAVVAENADWHVLFWTAAGLGLAEAADHRVHQVGVLRVVERQHHVTHRRHRRGRTARCPRRARC